MRGLFRGMFDDSEPKVWNANLLESKPVWYEEVFGRLHPEINSRKSVVDELRSLREEHASYFDRRFVYLICSRVRVRFVPTRYWRLPILRNRVAIRLLVGSNDRLVRFAVRAPRLFDPRTHEQWGLKAVETTPTTIIFRFANGHQRLYSVHNFLRDWDVRVGFGTKVHYVGFTREPDIRGIRGNHEGLTRVLYSTREAARDVFIYYCTFAVRAVWTNDSMNASFVVSNAMSDAVDIDTEGLLLEKALIWYFKPDAQGDLQKEVSSLRRLLSQIDSDHHVKEVQLDLSFEGSDEYFAFHSDTVGPSLSHCFKLSSATV